jgi:hypothetical protein
VYVCDTCWRCTTRSKTAATIGPFNGAGRGIGKDLECDVAFQTRVTREIDLPHAAGTDLRKDFIRT